MIADAMIGNLVLDVVEILVQRFEKIHSLKFLIEQIVVLIVGRPRDLLASTGVSPIELSERRSRLSA